MDAPNIYDFATSELSQDATLAYLLAWADPKYRNQDAKLNQLGENLLRVLVRSAADAPGIADAHKIADPLADAPIETLEIKTQEYHVDVLATINDSIHLIIEDKTNTAEHSQQIERYTLAAGDRFRECGKKMPVLAVYVKTGNECMVPHQTRKHGIFLRKDLLALLESAGDTGNTIVENFHRHLRSIQDATDSYLTEPYNQWSWRACQGFYADLTEWLGTLPNRQNTLHNHGWDYVPNPAGGFWGFWWHWRDFLPHRCKLYLQIENATRLQTENTTRLQIRVGLACSETDDEIKVGSDLLWAALRAIETMARQDRFQGVRISKSGRYQGGSFASVADVRFDGDATYLATDSSGRLDMPATQQRLVRAMELVDAVCAQAKEPQA